MSILAALFFAVASVFAMTTVRVKKAGTLASLLTWEQQDTCTTLVIKGKLNSADIKVLRCMAGGNDAGSMGTGRLALLDLSEAKVVSSNQDYLLLDAAEESLVCAVYAKRVEQNYVYNGNTYYDVRKYGAAYILDYRSDARYTVVRKGEWTHRTNLKSVNPYPKSVVSEDEIVFRDGLSVGEWKALEKKGLTKFSGHRLQNENGKYILHCFTKKGLFSVDFFYKCPNLRTVVLPEDKRLDENMAVYDNPVEYIFKNKEGKIYGEPYRYK